MRKKNSPITYSSSGVDIEKGNQLVEEIKPIISKTKIIVNAKKPGISLILCSIPISTPVKLARSTTKLFNSADQPLKAIGVATDIKMSINIGDL